MSIAGMERHAGHERTSFAVGRQAQRRKRKVMPRQRMIIPYRPAHFAQPRAGDGVILVFVQAPGDGYTGTNKPSIR